MFTGLGDPIIFYSQQGSETALTNRSLNFASAAYFTNGFIDL